MQSAELIKYAANAFLATKVTFINEIANLCEQVDANVQDVARGIGLDGRIGSKFLHAGPGYGGSCFPKDTLALLRTSENLGLPMDIVQATVNANDRRKREMAQKIIDACDGSLEGKTVAILGLTFKPNTDDMRDSPSLDIIPALQAAGAKVRAYDPEGMDEARMMLDGIEYCDDAYDTLPNSDALVIITEWNVFRAMDMHRVKDLLNSPVLVDMRNIYDPETMRELGFTYVSVGRPSVRP
nr:nucleotide sugar dehydrogenase [Alphaproteobacteria bacterium]